MLVNQVTSGDPALVQRVQSSGPQQVRRFSPKKLLQKKNELDLISGNPLEMAIQRVQEKEKRNPFLLAQQAILKQEAENPFLLAQENIKEKEAENPFLLAQIRADDRSLDYQLFSNLNEFSYKKKEKEKEAEPVSVKAPRQAKLAIGPVNDPYEQEADQVAEKVVQNQSKRKVEEKLNAVPLPSIQKISALGNDSATQGNEEADKELEAKIELAKGGGQTLEPAIKAEMEAAFGQDFSEVKVHLDGNAAELTQQLNAKAFTQGEDIFFAAGQYQPQTPEGKKLLAHELTHVVQQKSSSLLQKAVQKEEEQYDGSKELEESNKSAEKAIDPVPAQRSKQQAEDEGDQALKAAEEKAPETTSPEAIEKPESPNQDQRVAEATSSSPDAVKPRGKEKPKGEVGQDLEAQSAEVCNDAAAKAQELADNEMAHDSAQDKRGQMDAAVEPPIEENQSRANAEQVDSLDQTEEPNVKAQDAQDELKQAVEDHAPKDLDDLNNFSPKEQAKVMGNKVLAQTSSQVGEVQGTYQEIENAPQALPTEPAEALPEIEQAPETEELNLGEGAVPDLQEDQVDTSQYTDEAEAIYEKEGVGQDLRAEIEKVEDGDLGEANKNRKELDDKSESQPNAILSMAKKMQEKVKTDLQQEEQKKRKSMEDKRKQELEASAQKQEKTKTEMEKKREKVTADINKIYEAAKAKVDKKLKDLEQKSLDQFDQGQARLSKKFEKDAKRDIGAWKKRRYSGLSGKWAWVKDQFKNVGELPEVKRIFDRHREAFIKGIDKLIVKINQDNEKTIQECKEVISESKVKIKEYIEGLSPDLKKAGEAAQKDIDKKLADLDKHIEKEKEKLQQALCDKKDKAIEEIDKKIEEMKEDMAGLVAKLANFLLNMAFKFFKWALEKMGYDPRQIESIINKGKTVLKKIVTDPIGFFKNLGSAVGQGIGQFSKNIRQHLISGLVGWLTGAMGDLPIQLPETWDLKGILHLGLQILGLTWDNLRNKLVKLVGEPVVGFAEKSIDVVKRLINEGPIALWEMIKEKAAEIKQTVMEGIKGWIVTKVVTTAITKIALMLNPAGAIVQAIKAIYDVVMFFVDNWDRIVSFVQSIFSSIGKIAMGDIGAAANYIEQSMAKTIPMILSFLARFLNLNGISKKISEIIKKVRGPIDKAVNKGMKWIAKKARALFGKKTGKKPQEGKLAQKEEGKVSSKDKKKHKQIGEAIKKKLRKPIKKKAGTFDAFYKIKADEAKKLEKKYQPKLKKGIKLSIVFGDLQKEKKDNDFDFKIRIAPNTYETIESVHYNEEDHFDILIYEAIKKLSQELESNADTKGPSYSEIRDEKLTAAEAEEKLKTSSIKKADEEETAFADERSEAEALRKKIPTVTNRLQPIRMGFRQAARANHVKNDHFNAFGKKMFVDQENNYVVPHIATGTIIKDADGNIITEDRGIPGQYDYPSNRSELNTGITKKMLRLLAGDTSFSPSLKQVALFVASFVVEPSRYSIAHITNLLSMGNEVDTQHPFDKMSMTQGGSDPIGAVDANKDPRLNSEVEKRVTDRDIGSVKNNPALMEKLREKYKKRMSESNDRIEHAKKIILRDFLQLIKEQFNEYDQNL